MQVDATQYPVGTKALFEARECDGGSALAGGDRLMLAIFGCIDGMETLTRDDGHRTNSYFA